MIVANKSIHCVVSYPQGIMLAMNTTGENKKLTRKQQAFVKELVENPKISATEAAARTYDVSTRRVAEVIAHENMMKPEIKSELAKHSVAIEEIIAKKTYELTSSDKLDAVKEGLLNARWMHDKVHGRATQKVETQNTSINLVISMK